MELPEGYHCKVDYIQDKHGLYGLNDRIRRRRKNEDYSLRDLETYINQRVLRSALEEAGMRFLEGQDEDYYRRLTDETVDQIARKEIESHLQEAGVPVDEVREDFVSYQTVRKHLNECLDISTGRSSQPSVEGTRDTIRALQMRTREVVDTSIDRLRKHNLLHVGEVEVVVGVKVRCTDCGRVHQVSELLSDRHCDCQEISVSG